MGFVSLYKETAENMFAFPGPSKDTDRGCPHRIKQKGPLQNGHAGSLASGNQPPEL